MRMVRTADDPQVMPLAAGEKKYFNKSPRFD
jgi:hypothetical protein